MRRLAFPALCGLLAAASGLAAGQLAAMLIRPESAPLFTIGGALIDLTPTPLKEFAVRTFGMYDKPLLLAGIGLALAAVAATAGVLSRTAGMLLIAAIGVAGVVAALSRPAARPLDAIPAMVAAVVAMILLRFLIGRLPTGIPERRRFLLTAGAVAAGALVAGVASSAVFALRNRAPKWMALPQPVEPAGPRVTTPGFYTPVGEFYRVDTALIVPRLNIDDYELRITGMVDSPMTLSFADLIRRGLVERDITLNCVSNEVGGPYIGTTRWLGVPLAPLLREAGIQRQSDQLVARSAEGMTIGTPVETVLDGRMTMLAVAMDGQPLPPEHGFPVRMLTPGLYGYAGACKWLVQLELSTFDSFDAYWVRRGWAQRAPVKTASRIDRPAAFTRLQPGVVTIAGVAWAQGRGIAKVEVQVDDTDWQQAQLLPTPSSDTWVQWTYPWTARSGRHVVRVRATDGRGETQPEQRVTPFPDGATGWHTLTIEVS